MKNITAAYLLSIHGPATSGQVKEKAGITVKGVPISTKYSQMAVKGWVKKKKGPDGLIFSLTADGKKYVEDKKGEAESVEEINALVYDKGKPSAQKKVPANIPITATANFAIDGMGGLLEENAAFMAFFHGQKIQLDNFIAEREAAYQERQNKIKNNNKEG